MASTLAANSRPNPVPDHHAYTGLDSSDRQPDSSATAPQPPGTRVFKKSSPNNKITAYLGKRDFVDHLTHTDPIDGVVLVDPEYITGKLKVYASVLAAFRYGREDLDVLGLTFRKDLYLAVGQVYPPLPEEYKPLTRLQERLIKKLGPNAYPFNFELPSLAPASVMLQPAPNDTGKPCGVDYELKCFVAESLEEKPLKKSTVRLSIRKVMYAPIDAGPQPHLEVSRDFIMSPGPLHMEVTLDKKKYYHGEPIAVNVQIANNSNKTVKKIKITVRQHADICLFSTAQYKCPVAELESDDGFPLGPCCNLSKVYYLTPLLRDNRDKRGLALDGKLKHEDTNLASSTIFKDDRVLSNSSHGHGQHQQNVTGENLPLNADSKHMGGASTNSDHRDANEQQQQHTSTSGNSSHRTKEKESLGIIVKYTVKVKLIVAFGQDVTAELGFILTHPKPDPLNDGSDSSWNEPTESALNKPMSEQARPETDPPSVRTEDSAIAVPAKTQEPNLIELGDPHQIKNKSYDNYGMTNTPDHREEDDIIFEDFARLRLQGNETELDETEPPQH